VFDTVSGLPVHALVVHAVVVLLPLMSVVTVVVAARPRWRLPAIPWVVAANAVVVVMSLVARQSGQNLRARLGGEIAESHAQYGNVLPLFALALLLASVVVWYAARQGGVLVPVATGLAAVTAVAAIGWTVLVGDTGARSVWENKIANTAAPIGDD
jgi:hypothetical protein